MNDLLADTDTAYELRFVDLAHPGHGYVFPCDAYGRVDLDRLSAGARANYFFARGSIGHHIAWPTIEKGIHETDSTFGVDDTLWGGPSVFKARLAA